MQKSNKMILFAVVAAIIVAAPVSVYELMQPSAPQTIYMLSYGTSLNNTIYPCVGDYPDPFNYSEHSSSFFASSSFMSNDTGSAPVSYLNVSVFSCYYALFGHCAQLCLDISGAIQPGLLPTSMSIRINATVNDPIWVQDRYHVQTIDAGFHITLGNRTSQNITASKSICNIEYPSLSDLNASCNFTIHNASRSGSSYFHFFLSIPAATVVLNMKPGTSVYTEINVSLNGFSQVVPVTLGFNMVGGTKSGS
ncbi:MAG: hypothetical protein M1327_00215 [Candidatus Thermoplasmatota archaeon]|nr:hypothetical protein [Candidatus Thermoplasmatota archaeon]